MSPPKNHVLPFMRLFMIGLLSLALPAYSDSVHSCKVMDHKLKNEQTVKLTRCVVDISGGKIGDIVEIKNQYNYIVATGKLVKTRGRYALIILSNITQEIKTGYPVIVRNNDSIDYWTATKSPY